MRLTAPTPWASCDVAEIRAHGHCMDHRYYDFNAPFDIEGLILTDDGREKPMRRRMQLAVGSVLAPIGVVGLVWTASSSQAAPDRVATSAEHERMHRMMEAMHGPDAVNRIHGMPGGEDMMQACSDMTRASS